MRIELKCKCGATLLLEDSRGSYIRSGGETDEKGRKFLVEKRADDWQERHQVCLGMDASGRQRDE